MFRYKSIISKYLKEQEGIREKMIRTRVKLQSLNRQAEKLRIELHVMQAEFEHLERAISHFQNEEANPPAAGEVVNAQAVEVVNAQAVEIVNQQAVDVEMMEQPPQYEEQLRCKY